MGGFEFTGAVYHIKALRKCRSSLLTDFVMKENIIWEVYKFRNKLIWLIKHASFLEK